jgi:hypothetical protein
MSIRVLRADEIECRVQSTKKTANGSVGCILLLYKDARVDMKILDEEYGVRGWQRTHEVINGNLFCNIDIWDDDKKTWVRKQDVGVESNAEKEKGQASDSFKRAGFNIGIGRELYTSPFIWIDLQTGEYYEKDNKVNVNSFLKFQVKNIGYNDQREINALEIIDNKKVSRFKMGITPKTDLNDFVEDKNKGNTNTRQQTNQTPTASNNATDDILKCIDCKCDITQKIHDYSVGKFKKPLCFTCQKKY